MPDAEKIIAGAVMAEATRDGDYDPEYDYRPDAERYASRIAAALRDAGMLAEDGLLVLDRESHRQQYATPEQRAAVKAWLAVRSPIPEGEPA